MPNLKDRIRTPQHEPEPRPKAPPHVPEEILLPNEAVIRAGIAKFQEMARLHWPQRGVAGSVSFNPDNIQQLGLVLGLVHLAMCEVARIGPYDPTR